MTSTGSNGTNSKVWDATGDNEPVLYPLTVMLQATARSTTPCLSSEGQPNQKLRGVKDLVEVPFTVTEGGDETSFSE